MQKMLLQTIAVIRAQQNIRTPFRECMYSESFLESAVTCSFSKNESSFIERVLTYREGPVQTTQLYFKAFQVIPLQFLSVQTVLVSVCYMTVLDSKICLKGDEISICVILPLLAGQVDVRLGDISTSKELSLFQNRC